LRKPNSNQKLGLPPLRESLPAYGQRRRETEKKSLLNNGTGRCIHGWDKVTQLKAEKMWLVQEPPAKIVVPVKTEEEPTNPPIEFWGLEKGPADLSNWIPTASEQATHHLYETQDQNAASPVNVIHRPKATPAR
jgi:hypothetical protein